MLNCAIWEADASSKYVELSLETLKPWYVALAMNIMQKFGGRCRKDMSELNHFSLMNSKKWGEALQNSTKQICSIERKKRCGLDSYNCGGK